MQDVLAIILGGGRGNRLFPLTLMRSKPAVPIGGKYRLIDIPISNCLHAGLRRMFILTQFNSASLNRHIARTYRMSRFTNGFVEVLAADDDDGNINNGTPHMTAIYQAFNDQQIACQTPTVQDSGCAAVPTGNGWPKPWPRIKTCRWVPRWDWSGMMAKAACG